SAVCRGGRDRVVAPPDKLNQAEPIAEWVREQRPLPVAMRFDLRLRRRARGEDARAGGLDVVDDEVEVDRGPVAPVVAGGCAGSRSRAGRRHQAEDRRIGAGELDALVAEAALDREPESTGVEGDRARQVVDVDVDEELGHDFAPSMAATRALRSGPVQIGTAS